MTSDFIFIEEVEGGDPIVDGITPSRLENEWNGIIIELKCPQITITKELWANLLVIYKSLYLQNSEKCIEMLQSFIKDLSQLIQNLQFISQYGNITALFYDLLYLYNQPLLSLNTESILPFFKNLPTLSILCEEETTNFLDSALDPFGADDLLDNDTIPFIDFLLDGFSSFTKLSEKIRNVIQDIINDGKRDSFSYFLPKFVTKCIELIREIIYISPTIFINSDVINLLKWTIYNIYQTHNQGYINIFNTLFDEVLNELKDQSDNIIFYSCLAFFKCINSYQFLSIFYDKIMNPDYIFIQRVTNDWTVSYPTELLEMINCMISSKSTALLNAFFFVPNFDRSAQFYSFPLLPVQFSPENDKSIKYEDLPKPESYHIFSEFNQELPTVSPHRISLLPFLESMMEIFWSFTAETENLLVDTIVKFAATNTRQAYYFCFTQGKFIYSQVAKQMQLLDKAEPEKRKVFCLFVRMMTMILNKYPEPTK